MWLGYSAKETATYVSVIRKHLFSRAISGNYAFRNEIRCDKVYVTAVRNNSDSETLTELTKQ